jgi:SAM-dependent methyltransferase
MIKPPASNLEWIRWGERDPLFGVAAWKGKERDGAAPWTDEEFYANGEREWAACERAWNRYGRKANGTCLEIGCGAGRITRPLSRAFAGTIGIDVSPAMIARARPHLDPTVELHVTEGTSLPVADGSVAGVFSTFVFQHLERQEYGLQYFTEIARALEPGGSCMIHAPVVRWPAADDGLVDRTARKLLTLADEGRSVVSRSLATVRRLSGRPVMRRIHYEAEALSAHLESVGLVEVEISAIGALGLSWVFARRPE